MTDLPEPTWRMLLGREGLINEALAENPQLAPGTAKVAHPGEVSGGLA